MGLPCAVRGSFLLPFPLSCLRSAVGWLPPFGLLGPLVLPFSSTSLSLPFLAAREAKAAMLLQRDALTGEFVRHAYQTQQAWPLDGRSPSPLLPPNSVVRAQMDALMRNDWPEEDSGIKTAFTFSMPEGVENMLVTQVPNFLTAVRAWNTAEYISFSEFTSLLRGPLYATIINCSDWKVASPVRFNGVEGHTARQAVEVTSEVAGVASSQIYTFCLEKVLQGAYRHCWMVVGMQTGDLHEEKTGYFFE